MQPLFGAINGLENNILFHKRPTGVGYFHPAKKPSPPVPHLVESLKFPSGRVGTTSEALAVSSCHAFVVVVSCDLAGPFGNWRHFFTL